MGVCSSTLKHPMLSPCLPYTLYVAVEKQMTTRPSYRCCNNRWSEKAGVVAIRCQGHASIQLTEEQAMRLAQHGQRSHLVHQVLET